MDSVPSALPPPKKYTYLGDFVVLLAEMVLAIKIDFKLGYIISQASWHE
jgi:hypothetical protein